MLHQSQRFAVAGRLAAILIAGFISACEGGGATQTPCVDSACPTGLQCGASGQCECPAGAACSLPDASAGDDAGLAPDGSVDAGEPDDAGTSPDAGIPEDAGGLIDAGPFDTDGGTPDDGGVADTDGGTEPDGGPIAVDGGPPQVVLRLITVTPPTSWLLVGETATLTAVGTYTDGSSQDITAAANWSSPDAAVNVSGNVVEARGSGAATIRVALGDVSATALVYVGLPELISLTILPENPTVPAGLTLPLSVIASYPDASSHDVTSLATWTSLDPSIATISADGVVTGVTPGTVTITAVNGSLSVSVQLVVGPPLLTAIHIEPDGLTLVKGLSAALTVYGTFSDGSTSAVTDIAVWSSSGALVSVSADGLVFALAQGDDVVTANVGDLSTSIPVTVLPPEVVSIAVTPASPRLPAGRTVALEAWATLTDATVIDVTPTATWFTTDSQIADVAAGLVHGLVAGTTEVAAQLGAVIGTTPVVVDPAVLESIAISAPATQLPAGRTLALTVTGTYSDGSTRPLSTGVTWTSSLDATATVSSDGVVTGQVAGPVTISAAYEAATASIDLTVTRALLESLVIAPASLSLPKGTSAPLTATGTFSDGTTRDVTAELTWTSTDATTASVSAAGVVKGEKQGSASISGAADGVSASVSVTVEPAAVVTLTMAPTFQLVAKGRTARFAAFATFTDGSGGEVSSLATWSSSNAFAESASGGAFDTKGVGTVTITASLEGHDATGTLVVTAPELVSISIAPLVAEAPLGIDQQLTATGTNTDGSTTPLTNIVAWASSRTDIATISTTGLVSGHAVGATEVTASLGNFSATRTVTVLPAELISLTVSPADQSIVKGLTGALAVVGTFTDGSSIDFTTTADWLSEDPTVATVLDDGTVQALAVGTVQITATVDGVTATAQVTVTPEELVSITVEPATSHLPRGVDQSLVATGHYTDGSSRGVTAEVIWTSLAPAIAPVNVNGTVHAAEQGTTTIVATIGAVSGTATVVVEPPALLALEIVAARTSLPKGTQLPLTAVGTYTDGSTQDLSSEVTWSSDDLAVLTVSATGVASGVAIGATTVHASLGGLSASLALTVTEPELVSLAITPLNSSIAKGLSVPFSVTGTFTDGSTSNLTASVVWTSSDTAIASFVANVASAKKAGQVTISATSGTVSTATLLTVTPPTLVSLAVTPADRSIAKGLTASMIATGTYTDGSTSNLTSSVTWSSSNTVAVSISSGGSITANAEGDSTLTATAGAISGSTTIQVVPAAVISISVTPQSPTIALGLTVQLTATATFTDGVRDITALATWTSASPAVATVADGFVSSVSTGFASISASLGGVSASTLVQVLAPQIISVTLSPTTVSVARGNTVTLDAVAIYTNGTSANVNAIGTWSSNSPSRATVNAGIVTGASQGTATITVSVNGMTASAVVTVTAPVLRSVAVSPATASVPRGRTQQFVAAGTYSDNTTANITTLAIWSSSDATVATVTTAGLARAVELGVSQITATYGGITGSAQITVVAPALESIEVTPATTTIAKGTRLGLTAFGHFSDGTTVDLSAVALWSSASPAVASVSPQGVVQGLTQGTASITATWSGLSGTSRVTVGPAQLESLEITPANALIQPGTSVTLVVTGHYTDGTTGNVTGSATWSVSDTSIATASANVIQGLSAGTVIVSASVGALVATTNVIVASLVSLAVTPASVVVRTGQSLQFTATATYSDGSTRDVSSSVTWASGDPSVATIASSGVALGRARGSTSITASSGAISNTATLTVNGPDSLVITPASPRLPVGASTQFTATATFFDGTTADISSAVTWSSDDTSVATVSSTGVVTALQPGMVTISATDGTVSAQDSVLVLGLTAITVTPASTTLARGLTKQLTATGTYSDGVIEDVTRFAVWTSAAPATATVSASGLATAVINGSTTIKATIGGVFGTASITVANATLVRIVVSPLAQVETPASCSSTSTTVPPQNDLQLKATGVFSDGTTQDLSSVATWQSSANNVGTVSSSGLFHDVTSGATTITATRLSIVGSILVSVP